jgi:hypothetical protein
MARKLISGSWSMKSDRKLIELAKSQTLEAIADQLQRTPANVLKKVDRRSFDQAGEEQMTELMIDCAQSCRPGTEAADIARKL